MKLLYALPLSFLLLLLILASLPAYGGWDPEEWHGMKAEVFGVIRDESGRPLPNAKITGAGTEWVGHSGSLKTFETRTDSLGVFRLELPAGADIVWVEHPDGDNFPGMEPLILGPISPGEHRADLQFRLFHVRGKLLDADARPAPHGLVVYYATPPKGSAICGTGLPQATVKDGSFEFTVRRPVLVSLSGSLTDQPFGIPNVNQEIQINADTLITLQVGGISVEGTVRGYRGEELADASVTMSGRSFIGEVKTDRYGRFKTSVTPGVYRWRVQPGNREFQRWTTVDSAEINRPTQVVLSLESVRWTGRILDSESGVGLDSIRVYATEDMVESWNAGADCLTGPHGEFQLFLRKGAIIDLSLLDEKGPRVAVPVSMKFEEVERRYRRVMHRTVAGVHATVDSTFDIVMKPIRK